MNNNSLGNTFQFGNKPQFVDFSKVKSAAKVSEEKAAAREAEKKNQQQSASETAQKISTDDIAAALGGSMLRDLGAAMINPVGFSMRKNEDLLKSLTGIGWLENALTPKAQEPKREYTDEEKAKAVDFIKSQQQKIKDVQEKFKEQKEAETATEEAPADDGETIEYTYKAGDTFGQVIKDLGLESGNGLWGDNGDVNYYTQQLIDQGIWGDGVAGNIPIGTIIRLKQRPLTQEMIEYRNQYGYN